ncbi:MICAL-like protein 1 isoform X1 [Hylaeus volcanicus]|uniref:MICAL-like protein 1 isoform X1 n=1 Tax=Hylaeus volcanicus TaxID=313075 RepID=UPI0023B833C4|nr:MICAL-like protein 1 isoform X1 [Hylaeus volcanicus]
MGEKRGTKALELWCRRITAGYPGVNVQNMTTSWKDGLAFCAMIHHFRSDLIDFNSLDKNDVYGNNELAFKTAEKHLGIPALLDAEDMASCSVPDRLSILTYLSQFYQTFGGSSPSRLVVNRTSEAEGERIVPTSESPKQKVASCLGIRRDPCIACRLPVFLAEKLVVSRGTYHRTCFRCARCNNQLTLGNYYETEEGQFCCETCPDEDASSPATEKYKAAMLSETSENMEDNDTTAESSYKDCYGEKSTDGMLSYSSMQSLGFPDPAIPDVVAQTSRLRLNFISNHLLSEKDKEADIVSDSLVSSDLSAVETEMANGKEDEYNCSSGSSRPELQFERGTIEENHGEDHTKAKDCVNDSLSSNATEEERKLIGTLSVVKNESVNSITRMNNAKELSGHTDGSEDADNCLSLVQRRLKMFESQDRVDHTERKKNEHQIINVLESKAQNKQHVEVTNNGHTDLTIDQQKSDVKVPESIVASSPTESLLSFNRISCSQSNSKIDDTTDSDASSLPSGTNNINVEETQKSADTMDASEVPSLYMDKESNEDKVPDTIAKEINEIHAANADSGVEKDYPKDLNPFKSDEEEEDVDKSRTSVENFKATKDSTNPFDSDDDSPDQEENKPQIGTPPKPTTRSNVNNSKHKQQILMEIQTRRRLIAPQINLNSFSSDEDDHNSDSEYHGERFKTMPVPKPRTIRHIQEIGLSHSSLSTSNGSLTSLESGSVTHGATSRKKKPAPLPPNLKDTGFSNQRTLTRQSHNNSADNHESCPRTTPKTRKTKPAPPPPLRSSSPYNTPVKGTLTFNESPIVASRKMNQDASEDKKTNKDEANRNKQSLMHIPCGENFDYKSYVDKSTQGKWKRKKGPAPPCPMPYKRKVKILSLEDVKLELDEIEMQQQGLEKQGVRLEQLIRHKCESGLNTDDVFPGTDVEELVLELFALVNEKNELFRRQAELMLLRRQQRLEEEHVEVEYQIRCLMSQNESTKTDFDKQKEEILIQRLIEIVERRNEIVECLEMDRRREIEEDRSIHKHMDLFAAKKKNETSCNEIEDPSSSKTKKGKLKKRLKEKKFSRSTKKDIDKDIDETELSLKRNTKRKWF